MILNYFGNYSCVNFVKNYELVVFVREFWKIGLK